MHLRVKLAGLTATAGAIAVAAALVAGPAAQGTSNAKKFDTVLTGYEETPQTISTSGAGKFTSRQGKDGVAWTLSYGGLQGNVTQAHIHFGAPATSGGVSAFLCSNLGNGPAGTPACPPSGSVSGVIDAGDVLGPAGQGIAPGELDELLQAMRLGFAYVNVHSTEWPTGEIRGQLGRP